MNEHSDATRVPRRTFIKSVATAAAGLAMSGCGRPPDDSGPVPKRKLGKINELVSVIGLGGHPLGSAEDERAAMRIVQESVGGGINFMDNAWEYHDGVSERLMGMALRGRRDDVFLMTKVCTHGQGRKVAMKMLEQSLRRLQTDRLDLWMIHQVEKAHEIESAFAPGGVVEALDQARTEGKVRYVGFTGHKDPDLHLAMLARDYPFDVVLLPINCFEVDRAGFRTRVLPELNRRGIGSLGIKTMGGDPAPVVRDGKLTAEEAIRYSLSHPVSCQIIGMKSVQNVRDNLAIARKFQPMTDAEMTSLVARVSSLDPARYARYSTPGYRDGRAAYA